MTLAKLKRFGPLQKTFKGKGVMKFQDGTDASAKFTFAQLSNVDLIFTAQLDMSQWEFMKNETGIDGLSGFLPDKHPVTASGLFVKYVEADTLYGKANVTGYASSIQFGKSKFEAVALISFEIVNFLFRGDEFEKKVIDGTTKPSPFMKLLLNGREIILRQVDNYEKVEVELKAQQKVKIITCTATTTIKNSTEIEEIIGTIDTLCDVMSIARSTLISWTSYEVLSQDRFVLFSNYRNSVTRDYSGSGLIHNADTKNTRAFLEKAFMQYEILSEQYKTRQLARAYTETRKGGFIESRSMLIGVLAEYIASVQTRLDSRSNFLPAEIFDPRWKEFSSAVKTQLLNTYPEIKSKYVSTMMNIIKGINRRPFSWKLGHLTKKLAINVEQGEIEKIVTTRNNLAHQGRFSEDETPVAQYLRTQHFIDRLILRLFDYHGPYYDIEHNKMNEV